MLEVRAASNLKEFYQAYRLVHDQYASIELIEPRASRLKFFVRDFLPVTTAFVALHQGKVVGTASVVTFSPVGLPASGVYPEEIEKLAYEHSKIVESTKFACAPTPNLGKRGAGKMSLVSTALLRALFTWCRESRVSKWLIVVHPRVKDFYHGQLGFELLGEERECSHVAGKPGVLLGLDIEKLVSGALTPTELAFDLFLSSLTDSEICRQYPMYEDELALMLLSDPPVWAGSADVERDVFIQRQPQLSWLCRHLDRADHRPALHRSPLINIFHPALAREEDSEALSRQEYRPGHLALRKTMAEIIAVLHLQAQRQNVALDIVVDDLTPDELIIDQNALSVLVAAITRRFLENSRTGDLVSAKLSSTTMAGSEIEVVFRIWATCTVESVFEAQLRAELSELEQLVMLKISTSEMPSFEAKITALEVVNALPLGIVAYHQRRQNNETFPQYPESYATQRRLQILVVEDNLVNQVLLRRILSEHWGHQVIIAGSGESAIELIAKSPVDLVLLDIQLPGIDGFEVCSLIRGNLDEKLSRVPVHALTAFVLPNDRTRCLAAGMNGYLPKPLVVRDLALLVARTIADLSASEERNERLGTRRVA